jgi:hypothetical protein
VGATGSVASVRLTPTRLGGIVALALVMACTQTSGTARGVVTSVEGTLQEVTAFTVLVEGEEWRMIPVADGDYEFALPHLREHRISGQPILVGWEMVDNVRYALSLADG